MILKEEKDVVVTTPVSDDGIPTPWRFHLGLTTEPDREPIFPVAAWFLRQPEQLWRHYPLFLQRHENDLLVRPMLQVLSDALAELERKGEGIAVFAANRFFFIKAAVSLVGEGCIRFEDIRDEVFKAFKHELDLSVAADAELNSEWQRLVPLLQGDALLQGVGESAPIQIYCQTLLARREASGQAFHNTVRQLFNHLGDLLRLDRERSGREAGTLNETMGKSGSFFDVSRLAQILPTPNGSKPMQTARRSRIEETRHIFAAYLEEMSLQPVLSIISSDEVAIPVDLASVSYHKGEDCFGEAGNLFDQKVEKVTAVLRAIRAARLEIEGEYLPDRHDEFLANFSWQDCEDWEKDLLPAILVIEPSHIRGPKLSSFCNLLCSGQPIQVLLKETILSELERGTLPDPSALALAFRDVCVSRTSLARPEHMKAVFDRAMATRLSSLTVVAEPGAGVEHPLLLLETGLLGRATPLYCYDPSAGETMADRFSLEIPNLPKGGTSGDPIELTFAELAALLPSWRKHFFLLPSDHTQDGLLLLTEYLTAEPQVSKVSLPFIHVVNKSGVRLKAVISRELVQMCKANHGAWRALLEQAGVCNEYARRAEIAARESACRESEQRLILLAQEHAEQLNKTRFEAGRETMEGLARVLLGMDEEALSSAMTLSPEPVVVPGKALVSEPVDRVPVETVEEVSDEEDEPLVEEAYIDTALCTSCDECTNLNNRLFKYNPDGMAFIADLEAGTFAELVKAAEACPAKIIHPGSPRQGDSTVSQALITRAAAFN